jgi:hypothetical protein
MQSHKMSKDPKKHDTDPVLEKSLEGVRQAWSRIDPQEPPELLDQAVLNAARRELEAGRRRRPLRWLGGFATATVMVLALSLLFLQEQPPLEGPASKPEQFLRRSTEDGELRMRADADPALEKSARNLSRDQADAPRSEKPEAMLRQSISAADEPVPVAEAEAMAPQELQEAAAASKLEVMAAPASVTAGRNAEAEAWIVKLLELLDSGQDEKLAQELAAFKQAYPDYPLPDRLQDH